MFQKNKKSVQSINVAGVECSRPFAIESRKLTRSQLLVRFGDKFKLEPKNPLTRDQRDLLSL